MPKKASSEVHTYLATLPPDQHRTVVALQDAILGVAPTLSQTINPWGYLAFGNDSVKHAFVLVPHSKHVNLQIFNGAEISRDLPDLQGTGKNIRHIKFQNDKPVDAAIVSKAVRLSLAV